MSISRGTDAPALRSGPDRVAGWCGWVFVGAAILTPAIAWLWPLGYTALVSLMGLLCLPALRMRDQDRPLAVVLLAGLIWAAVSTTWSPYHPKAADESTALKLALQLPLYWSAWCGARRADPALRRLALQIFAWGLAAFGVLMLVEAFTGAGVYQGLRAWIDDPIRPDLARKNIAQDSFALALLWPVVAAAGAQAGAPRWLAIPMAVGAAVLAWLFLSDAPVLATGLAVVVGLLAWRAPRIAPVALGVVAAAYLLAAPFVVLAARSADLAWSAPASWAQRLGYWTHAVDWWVLHPARGWGLDASRAFGPAIQLHPHNGALQLWLELGAPGAILAAAAWVLMLRRLARPEPSLVAAAGVASAVVYLFFGAVNFGVWQEWWLALGALVAIVTALADLGAKESTSAPQLR